MSRVSPNVVILTLDEYRHELTTEFQRGVVRGKFEASCAARDSDGSPQGEKPQALSAQHDSAGPKDIVR